MISDHMRVGGRAKITMMTIINMVLNDNNDNNDTRCACEDPNMLTGVQFSLLLYRYLKDVKPSVNNIFLY